MNPQKQFALLIFIAVAAISCKKNVTTPEQQVENALDQFVASHGTGMITIFASFSDTGNPKIFPLAIPTPFGSKLIAQKKGGEPPYN